MRFFGLLLLGLFLSVSCYSGELGDCVKQALHSLDNPQIEIWRLRESGREKEADALEARIADSLRHEAIVDNQRIELGITGPRRITLADGIQAVWKKAEGPYASGRGEIATYQIDRKLGANVVPLVVERELDGVKGTMHLYVKNSDPGGLPDDPESLLAFDELVGNTDRHEENYFITEGRQIAIDHGNAFHDLPPDDFSEKVRAKVVGLQKQQILIALLEEDLAKAESAHATPEELQTLREEIKSVKSKKRDLFVTATHQISAMLLGPEFYPRLVATSADEWRKTLEPYLPNEKISAFLFRRSDIIGAVEKAKATFGEENILPEGPFSPLITRKKPKPRPQRAVKNEKSFRDVLENALNPGQNEKPLAIHELMRVYLQHPDKTRSESFDLRPGDAKAIQTWERTILNKAGVKTDN